MREAFEKKFPMPSQCIRCGDGYAATGYNAWEAQAYCSMWKGWQAAYAAGMERAAVICDRVAFGNERSARSVLDCADAIRAEMNKEAT
ncbi:hypothetical protein CF68_33100 [Cupriavidus sp. SK-4]|uniref:hypothetical protein n=1 Tax=Cupriavidus sp. SK-4 TaxID=574750 RepID=UPI00044DB1F1|nr:hypothetical protein [Cupriavidus sp. SK-4]EYS89528.1 hypothetical protein CF68_33100 [Cupriavidus sp. SK-4]